MREVVREDHKQDVRILLKERVWFTVGLDLRRAVPRPTCFENLNKAATERAKERQPAATTTTGGQEHEDGLLPCHI